MSKDLISQSEPPVPPADGPNGVESPEKIAPAGTSVVPFSTTAPSLKMDWPSETTRSRLPEPEPGYGTPVRVWSHGSGLYGGPVVTFESFPFHTTTFRSFAEFP